MRVWAIRSVLLASCVQGGCAHHRAAAPPPLVLNERRPFDGVPAYLRCPAPPVFESTVCPKRERLVATRASGSDVIVGGERAPQPDLSKAQRIDKLRALLAAIDGHVAGLGDRPTPEQRTLLKLSVAELVTLLQTWPDVIPEAEELAQLVDQLETTLPIRQPQVRKRMNQLSDLIRVQVILGAE